MPPNIRASFPFSLFFHFSKNLFSFTRTTEETRKNPKKNVLFTRDVTAVERGKVRDSHRQSDRRSSRAIRKSTLLLLRSAAIPPDSREQCNSEFLLHTKEEVTHTPLLFSFCVWREEAEGSRCAAKRRENTGGGGGTLFPLSLLQFQRGKRKMEKPALLLSHTQRTNQTGSPVLDR